jgi:hypothetical protein
MKKTISITLFLLLILFLGTASAGEVTMFGPKQYVRTKGAPNVYTDTFSAISGEAKLTVKNGSWDGMKKITDAISSASVVVNGHQIFGPNDFNQQVHFLEASINVAEDNSITVELASKPGSYLTIEITQEVAPPTVTINAVPETIEFGGSSTLTWTSTNANSCLIEPDIGSVGFSGSVAVSPTESTTYTITASGPGGTGTASVTVTVTYPMPTVSMSANPETILVGDSATLSWTSTDADSATIDQGMGEVPVKGSTEVSPTETTTYTITVTGPGGTATDSVTVTVMTYPAPTVSINADPETILVGESPPCHGHQRTQRPVKSTRVPAALI